MNNDARADLSMLEQALNGRMVVLEMENQRLRRTTMLLTFGLIGAIALSVAAAVMSRAAATRETMAANGFELRDAAGALRGRWGFDDQGGAVFALNDRNGIERARLRVLDDGAPGITLSDARGRSRIVLSLLADLTGTLAFADGDGNGRTVLGLGSDGSSTLVFVDEFGQTRAGLGIDDGGDPAFTMIESRRTPTAPGDTSSNDR
jgi:hypothetical protein